MSSVDMTQYLDLFVQEADEQLEILERELIRLEDEPTADRMSAIFRAAHTLKGSSRAMGFSHFAGITHEMENLLDALRGGKLALTTAIANALLECLDALSAGKEAIVSGEADAPEAPDLVQRLVTLQSGAAPAAPVAPVEAAAPASARAELPAEVRDALRQAGAEHPIFSARFVLRTDCVMKFVRAYMAVNIVQDGGELLVAVPDVEALEEERFEQEFELYFHHTDALAVLRTKFAGIGEVERFEVETYSTPEPAETKAKAEVSETAAKAEPKSAEANGAPRNPSPAASSAAKRPEANQTVRVDVARLEALMNLVGELVIDRTRIAQIGAALAAKHPTDDNIEALAETVGHIARITTDLQDQLMKARMLPIETVFNRFPRMVRDLAQKLGKEIKLDLVGGDTELDRSVIEAIGDPLLHILRNSIDHGVESPEGRGKAGKPAAGTVVVSARHEENHIVIDIEDDGKGIDAAAVKRKALENGLITSDAAERMPDKEAVQLIFASGLSTAAAVSEVSGRGVGMDIVRSNIQKLGGLIDVETTPGKGSRFTLRLPLTLAIIRGLLVRVSGVVYVLPLNSVIETLKVAKSEVQTVNRSEVIVIRGRTTPLIRLSERFATRAFVTEPEGDSMFVVVVGLADQRVGLVVDRLVGEQEVVIKSLNRFCGDVRGISGATILGNGNVALIADVNGLLNEEAGA